MAVQFPVGKWQLLGWELCSIVSSWPLNLSSGVSDPWTIVHGAFWIPGLFIVHVYFGHVELYYLVFWTPEVRFMVSFVPLNFSPCVVWDPVHDVFWTPDLESMVSSRHLNYRPVYILNPWCHLDPLTSLWCQLNTWTIAQSISWTFEL